MKLLFLFFSLTIFTQQNNWLTSFDEAKKIATEKKQYILLNFSGSDWCGPCMRMRKEIFESTAFKSYAVDHMVLLNADFPRSKKNQLSKEQQTMNDKLAEKYNPEGKFPFTLLLNEEGTVLKKWDGFQPKAADFVEQLKLLNESAK